MADDGGRPAASTAGDRETLLQLIHEHCTGEAVEALLRRKKAVGEELKITAENKDLLISRNLRAALESGAVTDAEANALLAEGEENGRQHVYFFRLIDPAKKQLYADADRVADRMWGSGWRERMRFPQYIIKPKDEQWADLRTIEKANGESDWVLKLYRGSYHNVLVERRDESETRFIKVYDRLYRREVCVVKWMSLGILQLRIPRQDRKKEAQEALDVLWSAIAPAINSADFAPWDLMPVALAIIRDDDRLEGTVKLGNTRFRSRGFGVAHFAAASHQEDPKDDDETHRAIKVFNSCQEAVVTWLPTVGTRAVARKLRTVIGYHAPNEVLVAGKTTPEAIDYVTYRLRGIEARGTELGTSNERGAGVA